MSAIPFIDLAAQRRRLGDKIEHAIGRVLDHGTFIMGPEVEALEKQLAAYCGVRHAVTCANGTDALALVLRAAEIGEGDAVFVPAFTFVATAEVIPPTGATPFFVDVLPDTFNIDPDSLERGVAEAKRLGLRPRMVIPVDLFGQVADYGRIGEVAVRHGLLTLADAAQSFGASMNNRRAGHFGDYATTSFFPAKPLGCFGDGGAIFTDDDSFADLLRSLRFHGKGSDKYDNVRVGFNSRLDTIQAAILIEKLGILDEEIAARHRVAMRYSAALADQVQIPTVMPGAISVWAQYTIVVPERDRVAAACKAAGIPTAVYYPVPLNRQTGYAAFPGVPGGVPVSEHLARHVLSLPMHPYLDPATQDRIVDAVRGAIDQGKMIKIVTIVGARPQFIKAAPVSAAIVARGAAEAIIHTGQHYDDVMSRRFFVELGIPEPVVNLGIGSSTQAAQTGAMMTALEPVLADQSPDWVVIYGDTNSTLAGALVAAKLCLPIAHVEAGLRSYNRRMPEEINRIVADSLSTVLFAPTKGAASILSGEGHNAEAIVTCGDVMYDAAIAFGARARRESDILERLRLTGQRFVLATLHRAENTDDVAKLSALMEGLARVAATVPVVMPLHPRTKKALDVAGIVTPPCLRLIEPLGYLDMARLTESATLVATDSGGLQKEAYFHGVPGVTLRTETEWTELVDAGWNRLAPPTDAASVSATLLQALDTPVPSERPAFYGDGNAAVKIADRLTRQATQP